ncbi:hypothetical protein BJX66DRAFT_302074 [Aspergillus keveii]|uniref:NACHT domain-containing protein n=1 Tax=Aspergillus keveii TaxID=714993 RepID=A0ABR4G8V3_9EURO
MAELAALGLASNIVQLVQFGSSLFAKTRQIAHSAHGVGEEEIEIEIIAKDLQALHLKVKQNDARLGNSPPDATLNELRRACCHIADSLLSIITDLKSQNPQGNKWGSFKQAVRMVRKEKDIRALEKRLAKLQTQIGTHLITMLSSQQSSIVSYLERLNKNTIRLEMTTTHNIDLLRAELLDVLKQAPSEISSLPLAHVSDKLADLSREGSSLEKQQEILDTLDFREMDSRYSSIKKEHEETFQWIFKNPDLGFFEWLKTGNGVFWIEGKAGSGKSTLIKYLVKADYTRAALREWAGDCQLLMASHFFWAGGSTMQKSQEGLLRTILFQVLRKYPNLLPNVCVKRWKNEKQPYSSNWDYDELVETLDLISRQTLSHTRFCFFVDGLDEFSGHQQSLVELVNNVATSPSIKICVSSRPWNPFVKAFDSKVPQLKLETLTKGDIQKYVDDKLSTRLSSADYGTDERREIAEQIVSRARGVFLWVYLVIDSLLRGLDEGDDIKDMRRRLDCLPDDLEDFFKRILLTIDKVYLEQTAKIFLIMLNSRESLPAMAFHYLEQEDIDTQYALKAPIEEMPEDERERISQKTKIRINARCRDLLEVTIYPSAELFRKYQVSFLHRTVRDFFLETTAINDILKPATNASFDPHLSLCRMMLSVAKITPRSKPKASERLGKEMMESAFIYEREQIREHQPSPQGLEEFILLDELQRVWKEQSCELYRSRWITDVVDPLESDRKAHQVDDKEFLRVSIRMGLLLYVRHRLGREPKSLEGGRARLYLLYSLAAPFEGSFGPPDQGARYPELELLHLFLEEKHLDPNEQAGDETVWTLCVKYALSHKIATVEYSSKRICGAMKLLLKHGADPNARCWHPGDGKTTISILQGLYPTQATAFHQLANTNLSGLLELPAPESPQRRKKSPIRALMDRFRSKD